MLSLERVVTPEWVWRAHSVRRRYLRYTGRLGFLAQTWMADLKEEGSQAMAMTLDAITIYPVKSMRGVSVCEAVVEPWGLAEDRRWMVVDENGSYLTQRDLPGMARIVAAPDGAGGVVLSAPDTGGQKVHAPMPKAGCPTIETVVRGDRVQAQAAGRAADAWLSATLGCVCRLVHMGDPAAARPVDPADGRPADRVSFADGFPLLGVGTASIGDLNARLAQPVPMARFRPNIEVSGAAPWDEDRWKLLRIGGAGGVTLRAVKPCARCVIVATDQETGVRARDREPLRTLADFRRGDRGRVLFGQNLVPDGTGRLAVGNKVKVVEVLAEPSHS